MKIFSLGICFHFYSHSYYGYKPKDGYFLIKSHFVNFSFGDYFLILIKNQMVKKKEKEKTSIKEWKEGKHRDEGD